MAVLMAGSMLVANMPVSAVLARASQHPARHATSHSAPHSAFPSPGGGAAARSVADAQAGPGLFIASDSTTGLAAFRSGDMLLLVADRALPQPPRLSGWPGPADAALQSIVLDHATLFRLALPAAVRDVTFTHDPDGWRMHVRLPGPQPALKIAPQGLSRGVPEGGPQGIPQAVPQAEPQAEPQLTRQVVPQAALQSAGSHSAVSAAPAVAAAPAPAPSVVAAQAGPAPMEVALPGHVVFAGVPAGHVLSLPDPASGGRLLVATSVAVTGAIPAGHAAVGYGVRASWQGVVVAADSAQITLRETARGPDLQAVAMAPLPVGKTPASGSPDQPGQDRLWLGVNGPPLAGSALATAQQAWLRTHAALLAALTAPASSVPQAGRAHAAPTGRPANTADVPKAAAGHDGAAPGPERADGPAEIPAGAGPDSSTAEGATPLQTQAQRPAYTDDVDAGSVTFSQQASTDGGAVGQTDNASAQPDTPQQDSVTPADQIRPDQTGAEESGPAQSRSGQSRSSQGGPGQAEASQAEQGQVESGQAGSEQTGLEQARREQAGPGRAGAGQIAANRAAHDSSGSQSVTETVAGQPDKAGAEDTSPGDATQPQTGPVESIQAQSAQTDTTQTDTAQADTAQADRAQATPTRVTSTRTETRLDENGSPANGSDDTGPGATSPGTSAPDGKAQPGSQPAPPGSAGAVPTASAPVARRVGGVLAVGGSAPLPPWPMRIAAAREAFALGLVHESWLLLRDLPIPVPTLPPAGVVGTGGPHGHDPAGRVSWGADTPESLGMLRASAALLAGQMDAARPLADVDIRLGPQWALWRALYQMQAGADSTQTAILLARDFGHLQTYPAPVRDLLAARVATYIARFGPADARAVLAALPDDPAFAFAQALLVRQDDGGETARAMLERLSGVESAQTAAYARAALVGLMREQDQISPAMAADAFAQLLGLPTGGQVARAAQARKTGRRADKPDRAASPHGAAGGIADGGAGGAAGGAADTGAGGGTGAASPVAATGADDAIRLDYAQALVQAGRVPAALAVLAGLNPGEQTPIDRIEAAWRATLYALVFGAGDGAGDGAGPAGQEVTAPAPGQLAVVGANLRHLTDGPAKAKLLAGYGRQLLAAARQAEQSGAQDAGQPPGSGGHGAPGGRSGAATGRPGLRPAGAGTGAKPLSGTAPHAGSATPDTGGPGDVADRMTEPAALRDAAQAARVFAQAEILSAEPLMRADSAELLARAALDSGQVAQARAALERGLLPDLPPDLTARRRYDEARLAAMTGDTAGALLLLGEDESDTGLDLRARLSERAGLWPQAVLVLGRLCSRALPERGALTPGQRALASRLAADAINANDPETLRRLRGWVADRMDLPRPLVMQVPPTPRPE
ncbi:MAG: hypothetical protein ABF791_07585 [Acetobacter sp.]